MENPTYTTTAQRALLEAVDRLRAALALLPLNDDYYVARASRREASLALTAACNALAFAHKAGV